MARIPAASWRGWPGSTPPPAYTPGGEDGLMHTCTLRRTAVLGAIIALCGVSPAAQDPDPIIGTWVLNVAASRFSPGPAPQSESCTYVLEGLETKLTSKAASEPTTFRTVRQEIKATASGVDGDGKPTTREWTIVYDGKDRPMTGDPDADMLALKRGVNAKGQTIDDVLVFDKR